MLHLLSVAITVAYHVPRNDALARVDPHGASVAQSWSSYLGEWTAGNHVRAAAAILGAGVLVLAALRQ